MTDLTIIYSKTPRGLRARASLVGGLSSHLMKVLSHVDGTSKAEDILLKFDHLSPETLLSELSQLEKEGYIKISGNTRPNQEWSPTVHFTPMVVEEYQSEEELEEIARAKAEQEAKLAADRKANAEAAAQREKERKSQEEKALIEAKSRAKAEAKMKEILEAEAREAEELRIKAELEAKAKEEEKAKLAQEKAELAAKKAQEEAELAKAKAEAEAREIAIKDAARKEKEAEELRIKAELEAKGIEEEKAKKAQEEAELAKAKAEAEAREIALKEAASKAKEAEDLRIKSEQEAKAKEAEALRIKAEQEAQAREEAARLAKEEAKLKAEEAKQAKLKEKEKEKQKAHLEIERVLKEAEEKRKKLAKKAKEEKLEAKRNAKAEEDRIKAERIKAESKSKEEISLLRTTLAAEEKANETEKEAQRVAIEKIAQEAEKKRMSHLENTAEIAEVQTNTDETRLKELLDEEEREKAAIKEKSRLEMERIAEEANALRRPATILKFPKTKKGKQAPEATKATDEESILLAKMEERARREAERLAEEEAELAEIEAEEAAQKKSKGFTKTEVKPEKIDTTETIKAEKSEKLEKLKIPINLALPKFKFPTKLLKTWLAGLAKLIFMYLPLTLVLLIGIAHFINLKMLAGPIENLMSESINDAVSIQEVRISLLPEPHLILGKVSIGQASNPSIGSIFVVPTRASIFEDVKVVKSAVIEDVQINHEGFYQSLQWINALAGAKRLKVNQINLKNLTVKIRDLELGTFDGELKLSASKMVDSIDLMNADHTLKINILNTNGASNLILNANNWTLPLQPKLLITQLKARGIANQEGINFDNVNGELYGGTIQSKVKINWATGWQAFGSIDLNGVSASPFLGSLNSPTLVEGKLNLTGNFSSKSSQSNGLFDNADMNADFVINHGSITGVELTRAVIAHGSQTLMGEDTHFDKLSGNLQVKSGMHQFRKVVLQSTQFRANAYFDVMPNQILSGKVSANLQAQSRNLQANFALEGTSNNVRSR